MPEAQGGDAAGKEKPKDFQVIRTRPAAEEGMNPLPLVIAVAVVLVAGAGWWFTQRKPKDGEGTTPSPGGATTAPGPDTAPVAPLPDSVTNQLDFLEGEGNFERALEKARGYLEENYPNHPELKRRIASYERRLSGDSEPSQAGGLARAQTLLREGKAGQALEVAEAVIDETPDDALAHFVAAIACGQLGDTVRGLTFAERAKELGHDPSECDTLMARLKQ